MRQSESSGSYCQAIHGFLLTDLRNRRNLARGGYSSSPVPHVAGIDRARAPRVCANPPPPSGFACALGLAEPAPPRASDPERFLKTQIPLTLLSIMMRRGCLGSAKPFRNHANEMTTYPKGFLEPKDPLHYLSIMMRRGCLGFAKPFGNHQRMR